MQTDFQEGRMALESTWKAVVIIPKGGGDYHVISLVEVMWKAVTVIINFCLTNYITFHGVLHGFWASRGTGTTSLEVKLVHELMSLR